MQGYSMQLLNDIRGKQKGSYKKILNLHYWVDKKCITPILLKLNTHIHEHIYFEIYCSCTDVRRHTDIFLENTFIGTNIYMTTFKKVYWVIWKETFIFITCAYIPALFNRTFYDNENVLHVHFLCGNHWFHSAIEHWNVVGVTKRTFNFN